MRIALMTESFLPKIDGIVTMVTKTVECLRRNGDEVLIFAPSGGPGELFGAEVVAMPSMSFALYPELRLAPPRASMRRKLEDFQPDILHLFEPILLGVGGLYYGDVLNVPLVISYHTDLPSYLRHYRLGALETLTWKLIKARHRRANLNLCTSTATLHDLELHGITNLMLWERAVDGHRFHPDKRSHAMRDFLSNGHPASSLLLYVGRLSTEKDIPKLRAVIDNLPGSRLAIVGDGPVRHTLERHFQGSATFFSGYLEGESLASAYASADLFVFPSETETLGLVLMEAMASGCPVVACRAGGVPDVVEDGRTGFLFESGDSQGLANAVKHAVSREGDLDAVRIHARQDVELRDWGRAIGQLRDYYRDALRTSSAREMPTPRSPMKRAGSRVALAMLRTFLP